MKLEIKEISADRNGNSRCWRFSVELNFDRPGPGQNINHRRNLIALFEKYWEINAVSFSNCGFYVLRGLIYFKDDASMCDFIITKDRLLGKKL